MKNLKLSSVLFIVILSVAGCTKSINNTNKLDTNKLVSFDWKTTKSVPVNIIAKDGLTSPIFIYNGEELVAAGYTPYQETVIVPATTGSLYVTTFPIEQNGERSYSGSWIWPTGEIVDVPLVGGGTVTVPALIDLHADIFTRWATWSLSYDWASFVDNWNAGATQTSSIILYKDKQPFKTPEGKNDVVHSCLWKECHHGEAIGGTASTKGTYLFEDMFPYLGDYDMNDMVFEESVTTSVGANNRVRSAELTYTIKAIGGMKDIAMAVYLPLSNRSEIVSVNLSMIDVSGTEIPYSCANKSNLFNTQNNLEYSNYNECVIPLFDNVKEMLVKTSPGSFYNVMLNGGKCEPLTIKVKIEFNDNSTVVSSNFAEPFIMTLNSNTNRNSDWRGNEIHHPNGKITSKMNSTLFGEGDTIENGKDGYRTYRSKVGHVWCVYIPQHGFKHPLENEKENKNDIFTAYPKFTDWINSKGANNQDWYLSPDNSRVWR